MNSLILKLTQAPVASFIFLVTLATSLAAFQNQFIKEKLILRPYAFVHRRQYFTIISSGFIHSNWMHLLMNMLTFWMFAFNLEHFFTYLQVLSPHEIPDPDTQRFNSILGHSKFLLVYLFSMIVADFTTIIRYHGIPSYATLGASGAISGIVMSMVILAPAMGADIRIFGVIPGWVFAVLYITYGFYAARRMMDNVNHEAHVWGAIAGIVFTAILMPKQSWVFVEMLKETFYGWMK